MAGRSKLNPFDDEVDGPGFGSGRGYGGGGFGSGRGYGGGGSTGYETNQPHSGGIGSEEEDLRVREQKAIRRMEESSAQSLRTLNETYRMGVDTVNELENQAETLDRVETRLDEMHVDLDKSKQNMRKIKSPFGGLSNLFSKKKTVDEVVNPKGYKPPHTKPSTSSSSNSKRSAKPQGPSPLQQYESTGSEVVDNNLDEMSRQLDRLMGVGDAISYQLDDSDAQIDRIKYKMDRNEVKMKGVTDDIKKQL